MLHVVFRLSDLGKHLNPKSNTPSLCMCNLIHELLHFVTDSYLKFTDRILRLKLGELIIEMALGMIAKLLLTILVDWYLSFKHNKLYM